MENGKEKLKFLYISDFHGDIAKYNGILKLAKAHKVDTIINGADLFPKAGRLLDQKKFILGWYKEYLIRCKDAGVKNYTMMGNDDLKTFENYFYELVDLGLAINLVGWNDLCGYKLLGYNYVPDYPFGLKDWCKKDSESFVPEPYISVPVVSSKGDIVRISELYDNMENFWSSRSTILDDLLNIKVEEPEKTIFVCHSPPYMVGDLDRCIDGKQVGSSAVASFIKSNNFLLTLHGHIHEVGRFRNWMVKSKNGTIMVQPGQDEDLLTYLYVEIDGNQVKVERNEELVN